VTGDREKCLAAGMNDHITKPINVNDMFNTMAHWITPAQSAPEQTSEQAERPDKEPTRMNSSAWRNVLMTMNSKTL